MKINDINYYHWLVEQDIPPAAGQPDMPAGGPPMVQPGGPGDPMGAGEPQNMPEPDPNMPPETNVQPGQEDIMQEPEEPDLEQENEEQNNFEIWKIKFVKQSIKGDPYDLIQRISKIRDFDLEPYQRKFVEDNLSINMLRQNSNIFQISNEIRTNIKKEFDRTNPAVSVVLHMVHSLEKNPLINEIYIKLLGLGGGKIDYHRKFVAALLGAIQVGSGAQSEDLVFEEEDYSIRISTRFVSKWGDVNIGRWYLQEDDPERYLKEPELERLESGSPEERDVLRRRIVIESIADRFLERAFIINSVRKDGVVQHLGWDLGNCLRTAFLDGKLVVRTKNNDNKEAFIDESGSIIPVPHLGIYYVKEKDKLNHLGEPEIEEILFMEHRDGMLYLTAPLEIIQEASVTLSGMVYKETIYQGQEADVLKIQRCVPSLTEMLMRQC